MAAIIRLKRKACDEPAEGLVVSLKKTKCENSDPNEVLFKFAATLNSEKDSVKDHIQAAFSKEKAAKFSTWRNPKDTAIGENKIKKLREKLHAEHKSASEKKKLDYLNNRRLILTEEFQNQDSFCKDAEVRQLFHLYDIIEENEDIKKQIEETENIITCNNQPLIREKVDDYVFDVYIADGHIDQTFVEETVSVRPCTLTADDIYFGDSDESEECFEDEDDSNDENNWRNDYPEEVDSEKDGEEDSENESYSDGGENVPYYNEVADTFNEFDLDDNDIDVEHQYGEDYSRRILKELRDDYDVSDNDNVDDF